MRARHTHTLTCTHTILHAVFGDFYKSVNGEPTDPWWNTPFYRNARLNLKILSWSFQQVEDMWQTCARRSQLNNWMNMNETMHEVRSFLICE